MKADWSWKPRGKFENPAPSKKQAKKARNMDRRARRKLRKEFWESPEWLKLRYTVLQKYGARCQCCGASAADGVRIHVDHILPRSKFPRLELVESNLQVLCEACNLGKGNYDFTDWRRDNLTAEQRQHLRNM
jgi:5-methylcytosine-specific restriction endonuclease McrA